MKAYARDAFFRWLPYELRRGVYRRLRPRRWQELQRIRTQGFGCFAEKRSIFVHVPKTGGISVATAVFGRSPTWHLPVSALQIMYPEAEFRSFFKFAFVRNPWDRLLSAYRFLRQGGLMPEDREWAERLAPFPDVSAFVKGWLSPENAHRKEHFVPQFEFLSADRSSRIDVDFVGRFERLEEDFGLVCRRLGLTAVLPHLNANPSGRDDYRAAFDTRATEIVGEVYSQDVALFGYRFE